MWSIKVIYFVLFAGYGALEPYMPVFYYTRGINPKYIGVLVAATPGLGFVASPVWGMVADRFRAHKPVLAFTLCTSLICLFGQYVGGRSLSTQAVLVVIGATVSAPKTPLVENAVITQLGSEEYGKHRLWGAASFGIFCFVGGALISSPSIGFGGAFALYIVLVAAGLLLVLRFLPMTPADAGAAHAVGDAAPDIAEGLKQLLTSFEALAFFLTVLLLGCLSGVINAFLFVRLAEIGGSGTVMGLSRFITCAAELPFFHYSGRIEQRLGTWGVLGLACVCYMLRFSYYAWMSNPWTVMPAEVLHGITFAAMWGASVTQAHKLAPKGMGATAQGILEGLHEGLGQCVGAVVAGVLYNKLGAVATFHLAAGGAALTLLIVYGLHRCIRAADNGGGWNRLSTGAPPDDVHETKLELACTSPTTGDLDAEPSLEDTIAIDDASHEPTPSVTSQHSHI